MTLEQLKEKRRAEKAELQAEVEMFMIPSLTKQAMW